MNASAPPPLSMIHDALVTDLAPAAGRLPIVSFEDHILRRFGAADILRLSGGEAVRALRASADEVWVLVEGAAHFLLEDTRPDSPTYGLRPHIQASRPTRLLLPFGVRLEVRADPEALLVRVMSHSEREDPPLAEAS